MKASITLLILFIIGNTLTFSKAPISNPLDYTPQNFDVIKYEADIKFPSFPKSEIIGSCKIIFKYVREPNENPFYFNLRSLNIDSIFFNGIKTSAAEIGSIKDSNYHWELSPIGDVKKGDIASALIYYHGTMTTAITPDNKTDWGGVQADNNFMFSMGVGFKNNYISSTQHWLPCYDHPSDKASFSCLFTVADSLFVASNGELKATDSNNHKRAFLWETNIPTSTYLLAFAVGKYKTYNIDGSKYPIQVYAPAKDSARVMTNFSNVPKMITAFESKFIPYPFEKVGYAMTTIGSMEHQTMISYDYSLLKSLDTMNSVAAHELSHQWFGDLVSPIDFRHVWLNESYATFCEGIWEEFMGGTNKYLSLLKSKRLNYLLSLAPSEGLLPLYDFSRSGASSNYPQTIYQKGALVVSMLRYELGDSLFFGATNEYLKRFSLKCASTDSLISIYEKYSNRDLHWFFNQWVYQAGYPYFSISYDNYNQNISIISDGKYGEYTNVPLEYSYIDSNNTTVSKIIRIDVKNGTCGPYALDASSYKASFDKCYKICPLIRIKQTTYNAEDEINKQYNIFPNPCNNSITIEGENSLKSATLYDLIGNKYELRILNESEKSLTIDVSALSAGFYFIEFSKNNKRLVKSFIKK